MSIRNAPEQNPRKTAPRLVSVPACCHRRRVFIGGGESVYFNILLVPMVANQLSRISFCCRQQMAMFLTFFRQPGGQFIFSSPIWRRIAINAPTRPETRFAANRSPDRPSPHGPSAPTRFQTCSSCCRQPRVKGENCLSELFVNRGPTLKIQRCGRCCSR
jgi:hypothetical protein